MIGSRPSHFTTQTLSVLTTEQHHIPIPSAIFLNLNVVTHLILTSRLHTCHGQLD